jgi:RNA polymerase sigma factor (sigma-70 family)
MDESQLLSRFVADGSGEAFAELVARHIGLVYSSARRQVMDPGLAEDVTQAVFLLLWRKAARVRGPVAGWLLTTTYFACRNARKIAMRRQFHERRAAEMKSETIQPDEREWEDYAPLLDKAMNGLARSDRDALTLRYFSGMTLKDVGLALGVSEEAARKRVDRGIERLRATLSAKVPTLSAATLAAQMARKAVGAAPVQLVSRISSSTSAVAGASSSGALVNAIAQSASRGMLWVQLKIAALLLVVIAAAGTATVVTIADANAPAPAPGHPLMGVAPQPSTTDVPIVQLVRWDAVLNESGEAAIRDVSEPVTTTSKVYEAMTCNGADLRQAVAADLASGGKARATNQLQIAQEGAGEKLQLQADKGAAGISFTYDVFSGDADNFRWILSGASAPHDDSFERIGNNQLHVVLDHPDFRLSVGEMKNQSPYRATAARRPAIVYQGTLNVGQAIVFMAPLSAPSGNHYCHLMVWEAFAAGEQEMNCVCSEKDIGWWCKNGPQQLQKWAGAARQWTERGKQEPSNGTNGFEIKLSDGKSVRLVALCRPSVAPFFWWDGHGNPVVVDNIAIPMRGNPPTGLWALVRVDGPGGEYGLESPTGHGAVNDSGKYERIFCESIEDAASLDVGVSIGPWKEGGRMKRGDSISIGDANFSLRSVGAAGSKSNPVILGSLVQTGKLDDEACLTAAGTDGKETDPYQIMPIVLGRNPNVSGAYFNLSGVNLNGLDYFRLWLRKRQTVTFTNFATDPVIALPDNPDHPM